MMGRVYRAPISFLFGVTALAVLFTVGCGKKAMPTPPNRLAPAAVSNFKGQVVEEQVQLSWSLPGPNGEKVDTTKNVPLAAVLVYRSKLPLEEGGCKNCPPRFEPIAKLAPPAGGKRKMGYGDKLERGFRYTYKIVLVGENDAVSLDSDLIDIAYQ